MPTRRGTEWQLLAVDGRKRVGNTQLEGRKNDTSKKPRNKYSLVQPAQPICTTPSSQTATEHDHDNSTIKHDEKGNNMQKAEGNNKSDDESALQPDIIVTDTTRQMWRQCLQDVRIINIPHVESIRPMKTRNTFVTKMMVLLAYLIVHADDGKPMPTISGKFKINPLKHRTKQMEEEIVSSGMNYVDEKLRWNRYATAGIHVGACLYIGSWLANQLAKARNHGTWRVVGDQVEGCSKGLYEPYRDLLEKIGIHVPTPTATI